ncbi:hypothetical protein Clacol_001312 [Clathrus columnatus]|uniref:Caffeine-induced death protein 2 n=1 Tax=Clathrus columnatus TaxID=1419009 RepID=A0AAV4ZY11_9AGAM|nr:hypothetical protein Clacol_001312 [Clathrus columnatus]
MPSRSTSPLLGSQAIHIPSPSASQTIHINSSTCQDISTFKEVMKEYRKLDDSVTMRLNRNLAHFRDRDRESVKQLSGNTADSQNEACAYFWSQLIVPKAGWKARTEIVQYCVDVVDKGMEQTKATFLKESLETGNEDEAVSERRKRHRNAVLYSAEVKKNQIHNELTVERIVRRRSLEAFRSRCKFFQPPLTDTEARKWWNAALSDQ